KAPLVMMLSVNAINALLVFLLVYLFDMGVTGIALDSVCGALAVLFVEAWLALSILRAYPATLSRRWLNDLQPCLELIAVNGNILIRTLCLVISFALFTALGAQLGTVVLAANALLLNMQNMLAFGLDGFAHAAEAIAGRAW